jgi:N-acetyl-anhydromuramyl-L-alanine amidase AmpD
MDIVHCLLDETNATNLYGTSLGARVASTGKAHLWSERSGNSVDTVVIHYTSAVNLAPDDPFSRERILGIFCDFGVSSHYLIERDGTTLLLVPETMKAWHAGGSIMPSGDDRTGVNEFSIGIELAATATSGFTTKQCDALVRLCLDMEQRYGRTFVYVGHEDVAGARAVTLKLRKDIKVDPGALFDWSNFRMRLEQGRQGPSA